MKAHNFFALAAIFLITALKPAGAEVKGQVPNPSSHNYVVIGAFSVFKNATSFTSHASKLNLNAKYEINRNRNLYYVYVLSTNDRKQAIEEALRLRKESPYDDTWVFNGTLGEESMTKGTDINPTTEAAITNINTVDGAKANETTSTTEKQSSAVPAGTEAVTETPTQPTEEKKEEEKPNQLKRIMIWIQNIKKEFLFQDFQSR